MSKKIPPIKLNTSVNIPNVSANKNTKGEKNKTIIINNNFSPSINNSKAMNISMFPPMFLLLIA